ncbi:restriction endonuclease subunit S [Streptococcus sobrinus]|uniref:restriction endonuclease subunit S n=1 Tax=Streptococcus sobrinus TaxID=1310 RepID=UPI0030B829CE
MKVGELFDIKSGSQPDIKNRFKLKEAGMVNTITGATTRNGINFYSYSDVSYNNELTIAKDGEYAGTVFLQTEPFIVGGHCMGIFSKKEMSNEVKLYCAALINKIRPMWSGNDRPSVQKSRLEMLEIELPFRNNKLAFSYMESYIKTLEAERIETLEAERIETLEAYLTVTGLKDYHLTEKDQKILDTFAELTDTKSRVEEWGTYTINEIFTVYTGRDVIIGKTKRGEYPLISHQHQNNGISQRISKLENRKLFNYKKTIALADRGVFLATTQAEDFYIGTRVKALVSDNKELTTEERLFITTSINKLQLLFVQYSANATNKLPDLKIKLPVNLNQIDYIFMSNLIKAVEKLVIKDLVKWADKKIEATREVVARS